MLKNILKKIKNTINLNLGKIWIERNQTNNFSFILTFNKKISTAPIIKNAKGILFAFTKNFFLSVILRPKFHSDVKYLSYKNPKNKFGFVIQGPITGQKKFLIESLKMYKKIFKNVYIILSTWENEYTHFKELKPLCDHIIINKMPNDKGVGNINLETTSTYNGLKFLKKKKIKYCLRTRTDCRIYNPRSFIFLQNLLNTFPIKSKFNTKIKNRILACSSYSCKYKLYGITSILLFSKTYELLKYFDKEPYDLGCKKIGVNKKNYMKNNNYVIGESYLCASFLNRIGIKVEWTMKHWETMLKEIFCIFDSSSVDFYWNKYERIFEQRRGINYSFYDNRNITFADWLTIYSSKKLMLNNKYREKWKYYKKKLYKSSYL